MNDKQTTTVYLAGGFHSGWQVGVLAGLNHGSRYSGLRFYDPRLKQFDVKMTLDEYGSWDFLRIRQSDIVLVNCEASNPSCIGLAVEAGYAKGQGKTVVLVLEPNHQTIEDRYLQFLKKAADVVYDNLDDAIAYLRSFA